MTAPRHHDDPSVTGVPETGPLAWGSSTRSGEGAPPTRPMSTRFSRPHRPRPVDEERRLLREAEAAFEGADRREDVDPPSRGSWQAEEDAPLSQTPSSRLFRD